MSIIYAIFDGIFLFVFIVLGIYFFTLFVKLARRGIKALDIYIMKNQIKKDKDKDTILNDNI
jgi:multidrug transporter EmrE-like cation transporter